MAGLSNFFVIIPVVYLVGQVDFTQEMNVFYLRLVFVLIHLLLAAGIGVLYKKITAANNKTPVKPEDGEETTVVAHDLAELKKYAIQVCVSLAIVGFLHFKLELFPPLAVQCAMNPMNFYNHNLFQIYFLGKDTPELRKRPWVQPSPFSLPKVEEPEAEEENADEMVKTVEDEDKPKKKSNNKKKQKKAD
mmetsp:Transcript_247/g.319  ORF Transcript_247/g.319 Transcript_247/m.319 type:complete len:190 (-) Transcript_247:1154-1723(-)